MIQFNLLPDVKKEYIRAKRTKRVIATLCFVATAGSLGITILLFSIVQFAQKKNINDLTNDIDREIAAIQAIEDIDKILTIQNQIDSLDSLHSEKPEFSRMFTYLNQLTPVGVTVGELDVDLINSTISVTGGSSSFSDINKFADTLKFARYTELDATPGEASTFQQTAEYDINDPRAFTNVLAQLSRNDDSATYILTMEYDPILFNNTKNIQLSVPENTITTRSIINRPNLNNNGLFEEVETDGGTQ